MKNGCTKHAITYTTNGNPIVKFPQFTTQTSGGEMQRVKNNTADNPTQSGLMMILLFNTKGRKNVKMDTTHTIYTVAWEFLSEY